MTKVQAASQAKDVKGNDSSFFRQVFDREYDYVHHSLRRLGVQERDIEDLAHDVFVEVYKNLERYDRARPIRPWLFAFAFRIASDYRRLARHRTGLGIEDHQAVSTGPSAEESASAREAAGLVQRALDAMPLEQRGVFVLYEIDETPMKEIADAVGISVNTAYSRLRLARATFAAHAEEQRREVEAAEKGGGE